MKAAKNGKRIRNPIISMVQIPPLSSYWILGNPYLSYFRPTKVSRGEGERTFGFFDRKRRGVSGWGRLRGFVALACAPSFRPFPQGRPFFPETRSHSAKNVAVHNAPKDGA
jgi:hypothetical protein